MNDWKPPTASLDDFRIVAAHGGADHHRLGTRQILGRMAFENHRSARGEPCGGGGQSQIRASDRIAQFEQHLRQSAHADSADAGEVDGLRLKKHFNTVLFRLSQLLSMENSSSTSAARFAAPGFANAFAAAPIFSSRPVSLVSPLTSSTRSAPFIS